MSWVSDGEAEARAHLTDHSGEEGASLVAVRDRHVAGIVSILWLSNYVAERGIPLVHQLAVAGSEPPDTPGGQAVLR